MLYDDNKKSEHPKPSEIVYSTVVGEFFTPTERSKNLAGYYIDIVSVVNVQYTLCARHRALQYSSVTGFHR